jgi:hypothetical protein
MKAKYLKTISLSLLLAGGTCINAQEARKIGDFNSIKAGDVINIRLSQADSNSVSVDADEKTRSQVKTEVTDGTLNIYTEGNVKNEKDINIHVTVKNLTALDISGSADVNGTNIITSDKIRITSGGAGNINLELKTTDLETQVGGAGSVTLRGSAQNLTATVNGAGDLRASNLEVDRAKVKVTGAGNAKVNVKTALDADVSGAGDIIYKGTPAERNVAINGAGSVRESKSGEGDETASDTTLLRMGNKKVIIVGDDDDVKNIVSAKDSINDYNDKFKHWQGIEIGVNGLLDYKNSLDLPASGQFLELDYARSTQFALNLFEKDFHIWKNYINIVTGFGFDFNHYAFANNVTLRGDTTYLSGIIDSSNTISYKKNKLNASYVRIPLLVEINTSKNPKRNFHIAGGVEAAYLIHAVAKQKYDIGDTHYRSKQRDDFNMEPFRFTAVARVGYNNVTLFANYGLNRLFKKDKGPQVYPFTVGVSLSI